MNVSKYFIKNFLTNMTFMSLIHHSITTKFYTVKFYISGANVSQVIRRYHILKDSLIRCNKKILVLKKLVHKSKTSKIPYHNSHTKHEIKKY